MSKGKRVIREGKSTDSRALDIMQLTVLPRASVSPFVTLGIIIVSHRAIRRVKCVKDGICVEHSLAEKRYS
jgi:hypothetical protein